MESCIELHKTYDYFDDGKITESRRASVIIKEILPFHEIDEETLSLWKEDAKECAWLYAKETDFFIRGDLKISGDQVEKIVFVRTKDYGWFSIGCWAGRLDVNGSLANGKGQINI